MMTAAIYIVRFLFKPNA